LIGQGLAPFARTSSPSSSSQTRNHIMYTRIA
jgi:hypothetical protein